MGIVLSVQGQELFPNAEPASNIPKGTLGVRIMSEFYKEYAQVRNFNGLRLMYGLTPKLSVYLTAVSSNHHKSKLPEEFPYHNTPERGVYKPYKFNGFSLYTKYRFVTKDGPNEHFRMAGYMEASAVNTAHDEGEPRLMDDTKGLGFGLIGTYLKNKFAVSLTTGIILPGKYSGVQVDPISSLPDIPTVVKYPTTFNYSLSFGYLLFPRRYKSYRQTNINLYCEFMGKYYKDVRVWLTPLNAPEYEIRTSYFPAALQAGFYVDVVPGVQFIINANTRIDLSANLQMVKLSYARLYPQYNIGIQHYLHWK
ncbi:hypothetical protein DBR32_03420 [Taibaiella sp. KBW10]|nr:hypothetical protein DBR32_03420 [Taibaiella sp. KBW10]